jgi:hypothetical protein
MKETVKNSETVVKRKKMPFKKKVKRTFKKIIRAIVLLATNLYERFMSLSKTVRYIIGVWALVFVVIIVLIIGSNRTAAKMAKYHEFEADLGEAAYSYVNELGIYPNKDKKMILDLDMLLDNNYMSKDYVFDDTCRGFSAVYYDVENKDYVVDSYLNCKHYTTKGFADEYNK